MPSSAPPLAGLPRPPDKPHPDECCHRGCCPCIFDYYYDALERWERVIEGRGLDPKQVMQAWGQASGPA